MNFRAADYLKLGIILAGALAFIWMFSIRPYTHDWQTTGQAQGTIKTLMSNSNVIGSPEINAVVTLDNGRDIIVAVPMRANITAGDPVMLTVQEDANKPARKRYGYKSAAR